MNIDQIIAFMMIITILLLSPGPSVILSINNGLNHGIKLATIGVLGNVVAFQLLLIISATSFGALILVFSELLMIIKVIGAIYLCYLGYKAYHSPVIQLNQTCLSDSKIHSSGLVFKQAFFITLSNPKALIFVSALLPQFIESTSSLVSQIFVLCLISASIHFTIYFCYAALASKAKHLLNSDKRRRRFNQFSGVAFIGFGISLGLSSLLV